MRTVLIGSDFMYDKVGTLKPIEINTNVGFSGNKVESDVDTYDTTLLKQFVTDNNFTKISYIGGNKTISDIFLEMSTELGIEYEYVRVRPNSITIPHIEDEENLLIIRSSYDTTAVVDDTYCRDKINFLKLIQSKSYGAQFAYLNDDDTLVSNITTIPDNGIHPNFILKCRYPDYNKDVYPKLYKVSNQEELDIVLQNVDTNYFLMEYYFNEEKGYNNQITKIRSLNILYPPTLESISIGQYTDLTSQFVPTNPIYDNETFELDVIFKNAYITENVDFVQPKLLDTDLVEMADGSWKTALDLEVGDLVKSINIPNVDNDTLINQLGDYTINLSEFMSGSTYTSNTVTYKKKVDRLTNYSTITFSDDTSWSDSENSNYLVERDDMVVFSSIGNIIVGDKVILIDTTDNSIVNVILKEVTSVETTSQVFSGWVITVADKHIFLTKNDFGVSNLSFAAIEHNLEYCTSPGSCTRSSCGSKYDYCTGSGYCRNYLAGCY
jgi:hypothetical protein